MDFFTLISLVFSFGMLIAAFVVEGGGDLARVLKLLSPTAAMIVLGGTFGAIGVSYQFSILKKFPQMIGVIFKHKEENREEILALFLRLANIARKDGLLALEQEISSSTYDDFIVSGIQLVIDGADQEGLQRTLETRISTMEERHEKGIGVFEAAGGFAPTMGVLGTVMGMVNVLAEMGNGSGLGEKIATAFIATLYGIGTANLIWLPLANKLKGINAEEVLTKQMMLEGIMMLQNGSNPTFMKEQLKGYLDHATAENKDGEGQ